LKAHDHPDADGDPDGDPDGDHAPRHRGSSLTERVDGTPDGDGRPDWDGHPDRDDQPDWDERYASAEQIWSGQPNAALVTEVEGLEPGRALDVGCGEGADAVWLVGQGWQVTAIDVSEVALGRAARAAEMVGVHVEWVHAGLLEARLPLHGFDLVSAQYPALLRTPTLEAERALLAAVAPRGHLLVVHHVVDVEHARSHRFDPADYVSPGDVAALLGEDWQVALDDRRPRHLSSGAGAGHSHDVVLHARRRS
jgi:SAM-dependent methyltransferase